MVQYLGQYRIEKAGIIVPNRFYSILFESVRLIISYDPIFGEVCFFERLRIFDKFFLSVPKTKLAPQPKLKRLMFDPDIQFSLLTISLFTAYCSVDYSHGIP